MLQRVIKNVHYLPTLIHPANVNFKIIFKTAFTFLRVFPFVQLKSWELISISYIFSRNSI